MPSKSKKGKKIDSKQNRRKKDEINLINEYFIPEEQQQLKLILKIDDLTPLPILIGAIVLNKQSLIKKLIRQGNDVNETDETNCTPFMWAIKSKHLDCLDLLLEHGANPLIKNNDENDALFLALESKLWDECNFRTLFLNIKSITSIEMNCLNKNMRTMLHTAVRREWENIVKLFINEKANVNMKNINGVTPLMIAGFLNNIDIVNALLDAGADPLQEDSKQSNALTYAIFSIMTKNQPSPHYVVEKLITELERNGTTFKEYLERCFSLTLQTPIKQNKSNLSDMKINVILYIVKHMQQKGIDLLLDINIFVKIKECLEKYASDNLLIRKSLIALKHILEMSQEVAESGKQLLNNFVASGAADCCLNTLRRYEQDDTFDWNCLIFSSLVNLIDSEKAKIWLERNYDSIKFLEETSTANLPQNLVKYSPPTISWQVVGGRLTLFSRTVPNGSAHLPAYVGGTIPNSNLEGESP